MNAQFISWMSIGLLFLLGAFGLSWKALDWCEDWRARRAERQAAERAFEAQIDADYRAVQAERLQAHPGTERRRLSVVARTGGRS